MTLPDLAYGTAADVAARDLLPDVIYEDRSGTWWCQFEGVIHENGSSHRVVWCARPGQSWATLIATRGELWPVPDFIPCELGDAR